jgi:hypothetical protein
MQFTSKLRPVVSLKTPKFRDFKLQKLNPLWINLLTSQASPRFRVYRGFFFRKNRRQTAEYVNQLNPS